MTLDKDTRLKGTFKSFHKPGEFSVGRNHENAGFLGNALYLQLDGIGGGSTYGSFGLGTAKKIRDAIDAVVKDFEGELRAQARAKAENPAQPVLDAIAAARVASWNAAHESFRARTLGDELDELPTGTVIETAFWPFGDYSFVILEKRADGTWFAKGKLLEANAILRDNVDDIYGDTVWYMRDRDVNAEDAQFHVLGFIRADKDGVLDFTPAKADRW